MDLMNWDGKATAPEKRVADAEDSFAEAVRSPKERGASLHVKILQLGETMEKLQSLEGRTVVEAREMRLVSAELRQHLDAQ